MKMNFQIGNCSKPNAVTNTCVFVAYEASDSKTNLHLSLDAYKSQVDDLKKLVWRYMHNNSTRRKGLQYIIIGTHQVKTTSHVYSYQGTTSFFVTCMGYQEQVVRI